MLALQIRSPGDGKLESVVFLCQLLDRIGVGQPDERGFDDLLKGGTHLRFVMPAEELHIFLVLPEHFAEKVFHILFGKRHVSMNIAEGHLRLDHPELGEVALRVGVLRPEGWAEGIDVLQRQGVGFPFKLTADRQEGLLSEEVLGVIDLPVFGLRHVQQVQRGDTEHLSGSFGVAGGDDRGVDI